MKKLLVSLCILSATFSLVSAQTGGRIFGAQQLVLDDNNPADLRVYLSNVNGSLGIDNSGVITPSFPNPCSLLDLSSTTKGFLPPRMTLAQELTMCGGVPPEGMLVYNTTNHSFDMYNGSSWVPVSGGGGGGAVSAWALIGNSGTNPLFNFLGTIDAQDLVIRTANSERLRVLSTGNVGIGDPSPASLLTVGSGDKFQVDGNGDVVSLKGVPYSWPAGNGTGVLSNDGNGNLSWAAASLVNAWDLKGNNLTDPETNFLGTIDGKDLVVRTTNSERLRILAGGNVGVGVQNPTSLFSVGNLSKFQVNNGGDLVSIKGIPYSWPSANAAGILTNDGAGNLSWAAAGSGSGWSLTGDAGTTPGTNFIGTTDDQAFEIHVFQTDDKNKGSMRVMLYQPRDSSVNIIGGYQYNLINSFNRGSVIAGGGEDGAVNFMNADFSFIGGGINNQIGGEGSARAGVISGGQGNSITSDYSSIVGGGGNNVSGYYGSIVGGLGNSVSANYAFVGGGRGNTASGTGSFVGGGGFDGESTGGNSANGSGSAVVGGLSNTANGFGSFIGGGNSNTVDGNYASISGGNSNNAIGDFSTVSGGQSNVTNGSSSVIAGGVSNIADGENAMILGGLQASAPQYAQFAQSAGVFASQGDAQTSVFVLRNTTTDGVTPTSLFLDGSALKLTLPNFNAVYTFHIMVTGICTSTPGLYAGYDVKGLIYRDNAGNVSFIGAAPAATLLASNIGGVSFTVAADNAGKALDLIVVGRATQTIRWVARVETVEAAF